MENIKNILNTNKTIEYWNNLQGKTKKLVIGGSLALIIIAIIITVLLNTGEEYVVLYSEVDSVASAEILSELQTQGIEYKYENTGDILIPAEHESSIRMHLAQMGHPKSGINYDVFTQNIDFMTTDYEKKQYELYQLQERMQSSIRTINGVQDAIVTISLPENKSFAWESKKEESTASVKLALIPGIELDNAQIEGITQLVTKSVLGLSEDNVVIVDNNGKSLKINEELNVNNSFKLKVELERSIAADSQKNITEFLSKIYGDDNIKVSASAKVNLDKKLEEIIQYLPNENNEGVPTDTRKEVFISGPGETTGGVIGVEANAEVPTYPGVEVEGDDITFSDVEVRNYVISQIKQQIDYDKGNIEELTIAVAINQPNMTVVDTDKVRELVSSAEGTDIDNVTVHSMAFFAPEVIEDVEKGPETTSELIAALFESMTQEGNWIIIMIIGVLLLILVIALLVRRSTKKQRAFEKEIEEQALIEQTQAQEKEKAIAFIDKELETDDIKTQQELREFADNNPKIIAYHISKMLKGGDE